MVLTKDCNNMVLQSLYRQAHLMGYFIWVKTAALGRISLCATVNDWANPGHWHKSCPPKWVQAGSACSGRRGGVLLQCGVAGVEYLKTWSSPPVYTAQKGFGDGTGSVDLLLCGSDGHSPLQRGHTGKAVLRYSCSDAGVPAIEWPGEEDSLFLLPRRSLEHSPGAWVVHQGETVL